MAELLLKNGNKKTFPDGISLFEAVKQLSNSLAKKVLVAKVNGEVTDLREPIVDGTTVDFLTFDDQAGKDTLRHTASHIMAQAIQHLFKDVKFAIGPSIENGFYYDIDTEHRFTQDDFAAIEAEMAKIVKENLPLTREVVSRADALKLFKEAGQDYKVELIEELPEEEEISLYRQGDFVDLCAGPHCAKTGQVKSFKLQTVAGAYWRGDEHNKMLQRIYGTAFEKKEDLDAYLTMLAEAEKRDHRKLGKQLDLFSFHEEGPGFPFFHPKGMILRNNLLAFWHELHNNADYDEISTPLILNRQLWEQSGHWDHYRDNMYFTTIDDQPYAIKPMNCPGGILVYKSNVHSYRDFPMRMAELGIVHRHELHGALHGLFRVRCFTQDDAHIFMLPSQMKQEISGVMDLFDKAYRQFGLEYHVELSTRPKDSMGSDEIWELATKTLHDVVEERHIPYVINEGDGAFYGPKLDFHLKDSIGRTWQCGTIQLDMLMPERFDMTYVGEDGQKHRPVMVHRACFGSIERFIGIITENYAGAFPVWLAPVQIKFLPISDKHLTYAKDLAKKFKKLGIRAEVDESNEKIGYKIRKAQMEKVPYMAVLGDKEIENKTVSLRDRSQGDLGAKPIDEVIAHIQELTASRKG
ncbi:threonyl-tRNA synthetase [Megasphaera cerevisiae DSM 20462]|uniref:Threonine--tRNA ligase n=1 Tax=Megasphaera cerevisiae DSM 20462 TaxID=1122219 RepID=A0A0J6WXC6_9FIRM|nr:threonine--tRNA ligase [Megasphaera cerevisiae]KMO86492.1 threonyl-tRNA synthetase [Megasphaera cerevisiae DSM 20462]SJZ91157.1 threonyl-tRNA synthetase [Megasphaera cerevisiae DSM 20462]